MQPADWIAVLRDLGLPAALLLWFMLRTDRFIRDNTAALEQLRQAVIDHMEHAGDPRRPKRRG